MTMKLCIWCEYLLLSLSILETFWHIKIKSKLKNIIYDKAKRFSLSSRVKPLSEMNTVPIYSIPFHCTLVWNELWGHQAWLNLLCLCKESKHFLFILSVHNVIDAHCDVITKLLWPCALNDLGSPRRSISHACALAPLFTKKVFSARGLVSVGVQGFAPFSPIFHNET